MKETIKLTNMEIVNILRSLNAPDGFFKSADPDKKLPVTLLFTISKNVKALEALNQVVVEQEEAINTDYFNEEKSNTNENGQMEIKAEFRDEFIQKKNELFSIENDVEIDMINVNNIANLSLTPADFQAISFMITDEE